MKAAWDFDSVYQPGPKQRCDISGSSLGEQLAKLILRLRIEPWDSCWRAHWCKTPPLTWVGRIRSCVTGSWRSLACRRSRKIEGWPPILAGKDTLISAPTGSGKTLAAFLACIDRLVRKALDGRLQDRTEVLYVSPLKALGNDIQKNLEVPLGEIHSLGGRARAADAADPSRRPHRRHADARASGAAQEAAAHSGHHARVALHSADHGERSTRLAARRDRHRR